jgi:hypothetical protein
MTRCTHRDSAPVSCVFFCLLLKTLKMELYWIILPILVLFCTHFDIVKHYLYTLHFLISCIALFFVFCFLWIFFNMAAVSPSYLASLYPPYFTVLNSNLCTWLSWSLSCQFFGLYGSTYRLVCLCCVVLYCIFIPQIQSVIKKTTGNGICQKIQYKGAKI